MKEDGSYEFPSKKYPGDVVVVECGDQVVLLVGTAHISQQSADLVEEVISTEQPDAVCVELDEKRFAALSKPKKWEQLDLKEIIRKKQLSTLLVNLLLSSYQKKLGGQLGVMPGSELLMATKVAKSHDIPVVLCDREVSITLKRAWRATSFWKKGYLLLSIFASLFDNTKLDEEKLAELRNKDVLSGLMDELGESMPEIKEVLIDERDIFMAEKIKNTLGNRIVAVVGAGHVPGITRRIQEDNSNSLSELNFVPPASKMWKWVGWSLPCLILLSIGLIGWRQGIAEAGNNALYWFLANGIPASLGALAALAHPLTIFIAFMAAPFTSLTPVIGAGYVCAFSQVMKRPPIVKEFETVADDMVTVSGWWRNRLLQVFLVFMLTGFGSIIGTWVGGYKIISNLFQG